VSATDRRFGFFMIDAAKFWYELVYVIISSRFQTIAFTVAQVTPCSHSLADLFDLRRQCLRPLPHYLVHLRRPLLAFFLGGRIRRAFPPLYSVASDNFLAGFSLASIAVPSRLIWPISVSPK
jgi:hypothetical protein